MIVFYWLTFYMFISYVTTTSLPLFVCITKKDHHFSNETNVNTVLSRHSGVNLRLQELPKSNGSNFNEW